MLCFSFLLPATSLRFTSAVAITTLVVLASGACTDSNPDRQVRCETVDVEGTTYCVYGQPITETGYDCPAAMPHSVDVGGGTVCSKRETIPAEHREQLREKADGNWIENTDHDDEPDDESDIDVGGPADTSSDGTPRDVDSGEPKDPSPDATPTQVDGEDPYSHPNKCAEDADVRDYLYGLPDIPWKLVSAGGTSAPATFNGTWRGLEQLDSTVSFDCPSGAETLNLNCSTDRALVIEHTNQGTTREVKIAVSLPLDEASFPAAGTSVRVTYGMSSRDTGLWIVDEQTGQYILAVKVALGEPVDFGSPLELTRSYSSIDLSLDIEKSSDGKTDPSTAYCVAWDGCPRTFRFEYLPVAGTMTQELAPGDVATIQTSDSTYRFSHLATKTKTSVRGWAGACADAREAASSFGFVKTR